MSFLSNSLFSHANSIKFIRIFTSCSFDVVFCETASGLNAQDGDEELPDVFSEILDEEDDAKFDSEIQKIFPRFLSQDTRIARTTISIGCKLVESKKKKRMSLEEFINEISSLLYTMISSASSSASASVPAFPSSSSTLSPIVTVPIMTSTSIEGASSSEGECAMVVESFEETDVIAILDCVKDALGFEALRAGQKAVCVEGLINKKDIVWNAACDSGKSALSFAFAVASTMGLCGFSQKTKILHFSPTTTLIQSLYADTKKCKHIRACTPGHGE